MNDKFANEEWYQTVKKQLKQASLDMDDFLVWLNKGGEKTDWSKDEVSRKLKAYLKLYGKLGEGALPTQESEEDESPMPSPISKDVGLIQEPLSVKLELPKVNDTVINSEDSSIQESQKVAPEVKSVKVEKVEKQKKGLFSTRNIYWIATEPSNWKVPRRLSDFKWLSERLSREFPQLLVRFLF